MKRLLWLMIVFTLFTIQVTSYAGEVSTEENSVTPTGISSEEAATEEPGYLESLQQQKDEGLFSLENIFLVIVCGLAIYFFYIKPSKTKAKKAIEGKNTQDLLYYDEIEADGLILLPNNKYRRMLEITPTNISIKSPAEQAATWEEYRNTIDNISVDWTQIVQTRIVRFKDYVEEQTKRNNELKTKHPALYEHLNLVLSQMISEYEEHERRERKYFIILKVDAEDLLKGNDTLSSDNGIMSMFTKSVSSSKKYDDKELRNIAESELNNAIVMISNGLTRAGIGVKVLYKYGVLDYLNHTYNRDLAYVQDVQETIEKQGVLSPIKKSTTVDDFINELKLDMAFMGNRATTAENVKTESEVAASNE